MDSEDNRPSDRRQSSSDRRRTTGRRNNDRRSEDRRNNDRRKTPNSEKPEWLKVDRRQGDRRQNESRREQRRKEERQQKKWRQALLYGVYFTYLGWVNRVILFLHQAHLGIMKYRYASMLLMLGLTFFFAYGVKDIKVDMSIDSTFTNDDPLKQSYDQMRRLFGGDIGVYIVYHPHDQQVFSQKSIQLLQQLHQDLEDTQSHHQHPILKRITRVQSLLNVQQIEAESDQILSRPLIGDTLPTSNEELQALQKTALQSDDLQRVFISEEGRYAGILIRTDLGAPEDLWESDISDILDDGSLELDFSEEVVSDEFLEETATSEEFETVSMETHFELTQALQSILDKPEYQSQFKFHMVGLPPMMAFFHTILMDGSKILLPIIFIFLMLALYYFFRSISAVLWGMIIIFSAIIWMLGAIGWAGVSITVFIGVMVTLVLVIAVADVIHVYSKYFQYRADGKEHLDALSAAYQNAAFACFLTTATTCIGVGVFVFVPFLPIQNMGVFSAVGVLAAFILTMFLLPVLLNLTPPKVEKATAVSHWWSNIANDFLIYLIRRVQRYPKQIVIAFSVTGMILFVGAIHLSIDYNTINAFPEDHPVVSSMEVVDEKMVGVRSVDLIIDTKAVGSFQKPEWILFLQFVQQYAEFHEGTLVRKSMSLANMIESTQEALNPNQKARLLLLLTEQELEQMLLMLSSSSYEELKQWVTDDYQVAHLKLYLRNAGSREYEAWMKEFEAYIAKTSVLLKQDYPHLELSVTGEHAISVKLINKISDLQWSAFLMALAMIGVVLLLVFGTLKVSALALVTNIFPVLTILGTMGYLGIDLDMDTLLIAPVILGIAIDDTIHFLIHYRESMLSYEFPEEAIEDTLSSIGPALIFTSIVLSVGFLVVALSEHQGISNFGILSAVAIVSALFTDLLLLPALCLLTRVRFGVLSLFE